MATIEHERPPLVAGDFLSRDEFLRRWELMPHLKHAELIRGIVYMPSPLSLPHGRAENDVGTWLGVYKAATPGCDAANNATWLMEDSAPQPDLSLCILPEYGGQSAMQGRYASGAPEFLAEICVSSTVHDLHQKLDLYESAGVREYLAVLPTEREVRWHQRHGSSLMALPMPADGVYRSAAFPGLWLEVAAILAGNLAQVLAVLDRGLRSKEHEEFVQRLAERRKG
jgi:Uma2 family endonuclease